MHQHPDPEFIPALGEPLPAAWPSHETLELLRLRRSTMVANMTGPGPEGDVRDRILALGARVPDHRRVVPYRFVCFEGAARAAAGEVIAAAFAASNPGTDDAAYAMERDRFLRAPLVIAVVYSPDRGHKTPLWEQTLCCGAVCQNLLIAASASGFAAQWLTEWYAYDRAVLAGFGLAPHEDIAGFVYIGTAAEAPLERPRVDAPDITTHWQG